MHNFRQNALDGRSSQLKQNLRRTTNLDISAQLDKSFSKYIFSNAIFRFEKTNFELMVIEMLTINLQYLKI